MFEWSVEEEERKGMDYMVSKRLYGQKHEYKRKVLALACTNEAWC